jgi:hypothetical protein
VTDQGALAALFAAVLRIEGATADLHGALNALLDTPPPDVSTELHDGDPIPATTSIVCPLAPAPAPTRETT